MILDTIEEKTAERIQEEKRKLPLEELKKIVREKMAQEPSGGASQRIAPGSRVKEDSPEEREALCFESALAKDGMSFICEVKKASPSKGVIAQDFPYTEIAREYERAGASAISILTEPFFFQGSDSFLREIRREVSIPLLRKDFTVDEYMIWQAKEMGADAVLLICAILSRTQLSEYAALARELGLSALVEAHDEKEVEMALSANARIIGVNNRNLKDFTVDIQNSIRLRKLVPKERLFVSESGMKNRADIARLEENHVNAVLIGETFMRSPNKKEMLDELAGRN